MKIKMYCVPFILMLSIFSCSDSGESSIKKAITFMKNGSLNEARTELKLIESKSEYYSQAQKLLGEIDIKECNFEPVSSLNTDTNFKNVCSEGSLSELDYFVQIQKVDINKTKFTWDGYTMGPCLNLAVNSKVKPFCKVKYLLDKGAKPDLTFERSGVTPMMNVIMNSDITSDEKYRIVEALLKSGANPNLRDKFKFKIENNRTESALDYARDKSEYKILQLLKESGAN